MSEIPEDIRATAQALLVKHTDQVGGCPRIDWYAAHNAMAEALMAERERTNQRWRDMDGQARESGLLISPVELAEAVMAERERCAQAARDFLQSEFMAGYGSLPENVAEAILKGTA